MVEADLPFAPARQVEADAVELPRLAAEAVEVLDADRSGTVEFEQFVRWCARSPPSASV
jgi:hypothetical protein